MPVNKLPPEILGLIPDFLDPRDRDRDLITLTHVCRAWREVFVSRSSLWTNFNCVNRERTRVYLERSRSSPIDVKLNRGEHTVLHDSPFFQVFPHATGRLKSLSVLGTPEEVEDITPHLSHPAPLLEHLSIYAGHCCKPHDYPALTSALFSGDLSSLRSLCIQFVRTELPWRNMVNLTFFTLGDTPPGAVSIGQLLDFFESAPYLRTVSLSSATPTGARNGRLISLAHLTDMYIEGNSPTSVLLDHLLIPAGANLEIWPHRYETVMEEYLPRSLDNLKNLSNFTTIKLYPIGIQTRVEFTGPNGRVSTAPTARRTGRIDVVFELLPGLDTSKTERLRIKHGDLLSGGSARRALLPMTDLLTLTLDECKSPYNLIRALQPGMDSSEVVACPKLKELVLILPTRGEAFDMTNVIEMAAARASRGMKIRTIRISDQRDEANVDLSELRKHVGNVKYYHEV